MISNPGVYSFENTVAAAPVYTPSYSYAPAMPTWNAPMMNNYVAPMANPYTKGTQPYYDWNIAQGINDYS